MALLAQQLSRWFNSVKLNSFIKATQVTKHSARPGKTLMTGFSAQALLSFDTCFLQRGIKTYRTLFSCSSFHSASTNRKKSTAKSTLLPSVSEQQEKILSLESELPLEELDDLPPLSPLQSVSEEEAIQIAAYPLLPLSSFTLADYIDHSKTLQKLVQLGVDLSKIEKHPDAANLLLRLDFEKHIKQILLFLKDLGLEDNQLGPFLTKNYAIFSEDLENLKTRILDSWWSSVRVRLLKTLVLIPCKECQSNRVAFLQSKKFSKTDIARMVKNAPFLLSFSVERLDNRLGFFQKELELNVQKTRDLVVRLPRLLTGSLEPMKENLKVYHLELGFKHNEIQHMVIKIPKMLTANKRKLTDTFDYVHNVMNIPHHIIVKFPQ
ncbi:transcription termination factor 3, mitochondrial isoform X2 [Mus pahari]|uniref:transcription termination factor 3, mitochondrial isoform X2 n=1 Tax=Mus pahari TaxID=10093 RepID=UPI0011150371|nr:transcription termination factor 3, mitochondrial isoform X2 [Mus pahari]